MSRSRRKARRPTQRRSAIGWYAARCVFRHDGLRAVQRRRYVYEERIVLVRAGSEAEALRRAEREAAEYASDSVRYLGFVETFSIAAARIRDGSEVFSLMRSSNKPAAGFVTRYFDDGSEHRR